MKTLKKILSGQKQNALRLCFKSVAKAFANSNLIKRFYTKYINEKCSLLSITIPRAKGKRLLLRKKIKRVLFSAVRRTKPTCSGGPKASGGFCSTERFFVKRRLILRKKKNVRARFFPHNTVSTVKPYMYNASVQQLGFTQDRGYRFCIAEITHIRRVFFASSGFLDGFRVWRLSVTIYAVGYT